MTTPSSKTATSEFGVAVPVSVGVGERSYPEPFVQTIRIICI
jgi:hypothetical protein